MATPGCLYCFPVCVSLSAGWWNRSRMIEWVSSPKIPLKCMLKHFNKDLWKRTDMVSISYPQNSRPSVKSTGILLELGCPVKDLWTPRQFRQSGTWCFPVFNKGFLWCKTHPWLKTCALLLGTQILLVWPGHPEKPNLCLFFQHHWRKLTFPQKESIYLFYMLQRNPWPHLVRVK